jgi:hypothetical protein
MIAREWAFFRLFFASFSFYFIWFFGGRGTAGERKGDRERGSFVAGRGGARRNSRACLSFFGVFGLRLWYISELVCSCACDEMQRLPSFSSESFLLLGWGRARARAGWRAKFLCPSHPAPLPALMLDADAFQEVDFSPQTQTQTTEVSFIQKPACFLCLDFFELSRESLLSLSFSTAPVGSSPHSNARVFATTAPHSGSRRATPRPRIVHLDRALAVGGA